jgi:hypothetical protein
LIRACECWRGGGFVVVGVFGVVGGSVVVVDSAYCDCVECVVVVVVADYVVVVVVVVVAAAAAAVAAVVAAAVVDHENNVLEIVVLSGFAGMDSLGLGRLGGDDDVHLSHWRVVRFP